MMGLPSETLPISNSQFIQNKNVIAIGLLFALLHFHKECKIWKAEAAIVNRNVTALMLELMLFFSDKLILQSVKMGAKCKFSK